MQVRSTFTRNFMSILDRKLSDPNLNGATLAAEMQMSRMHLHRHLKRYYGKSVVTLIREVRMARGKELLMYSDLSISAIAGLVGFTNHAYFSKVFREYFGMTPTDTRNHKNQ